jgi:alpha-L-arabinofuranosidase
LIPNILKRANVLARSTVLVALLASAPMPVLGLDSPGPLTVHADQSGPVINRDIFGQFAEHIGYGIYGGVWVGEESKIPNVRGIRSDVVAALRDIKVPVVRWPGGCFADKYHWRNGIGPADQRKVTLNSIWGGVTEPNTFGTDEFMDFAQQIGAEAYVSVNVGSGTPREAAEWLEYMTTDKPTTLGQERVANGHAAPYRVKYIGMGNEMWGCGAAMRPETYVDQLKQYVMHVDSRHPDQIDIALLRRSPQGALRIASGDGGGEDGKGYGYTEAIMKAWAGRDPWFWNIEGISMHHYTWGESMMQSLATDFGEKEYAGLLHETFEMDELIENYSVIMDKYDPEKKVILAVDEWGVWLKAMPGLHPMFLKQQNSLRDAIAASLNLHIFMRHADRVRMTNIAQMVNVLQSMILTDKEKMVLTPTYHLYKMYVPFQDAQFIPISFEGGAYKFEDISMQQVDAVAARGKDGKIWLALSNLDPNRPADIAINMPGVSAKAAIGEVLSAKRFDAINTFDAPDVVARRPISFKASGGKLVLNLPPHSVTVVGLEQ